MVKKKNIEINEGKLNIKTTAFVVALSEDMGLVAVSTYPKSLDQFDFIDFLKKIRKIYGTQQIAIYIDNAPFHKADRVKTYASNNQIELLFAPVYSPEFQPSESLIGFLKQHVKKKRLQNIFNGIEESYEKLLNEAKKKVTKELCIKIIKHHLKEFDKY